MPLNTREGVAEAPIEPGARTLCEPWDFGPAAKLWRLIVPWKPLPLPMPATLTVWPTSNASTVTVSPTVSSPASSRNSDVAQRRRVGLLEVAERGLVRRLLAHGAEAELDGLVAVALGVRTPVTGHGPASSTVTRSTRPSSRKRWVMPSFLARMAGMSGR